MPEGPVLKAWWYRMARALGANGRASGAGGNRIEGPITGRFILFPRCFSVGTDVKSYVSCTTQLLDGYEPTIDVSHDVQNEHTTPSVVDRERSRNADWAYLLSPRLWGPVHVSVRGKILGIAAGHHLVFVNFGLEASVMKVSAEDFAALTQPSQDVAGPSKAKGKSEKMRSFAIPEQFKTEGAKPSELRRLNIFLALECSDGNVWLFVDHVRLIRFHVVSQATMWTADELATTSTTWAYAWNNKYGPSWFSDDLELAQHGLDDFRAKVKKDIESGGGPSELLVYAISDNMELFNGFGKHTANDVLHDLGLFPLMPFRVVLADDTLYSRFCEGLLAYVRQFSNRDFFHLVAGECNSINPFTFHLFSNDQYIRRFVRVYSKNTISMDQEVYNRFVHEGLLDDAHHFGTTYTGTMEPSTKVTKLVPVYTYRCGKQVVYSVIQAKMPAEWGIEQWEKSEVEQDLRAAGRKTTLGVAQFHQFNSNMPYDSSTLMDKGQPGRRATIHTGKPGRPRKAPKIESLRAMAKRGKQARYPKPPSDIGNQSEGSTRGIPAEDSDKSGKRVTRAQGQSKRCADFENDPVLTKRSKKNN